MPYEMDWEPTAGETGEAKIDVVALSEKGTELARTTLKVTLVPPATATPLPATEVVPIATPTGIGGGNGLSTTLLIIFGLVGLLILAALIVFIVIFTRRKQKETEMDRPWHETVGGVGKAESVSSMGEERTLDAFIASPDALGMLVVLESDDPVLKGQRFEITRSTTTLGRKADNDLLFPKDSPVSRHHAIIEQRDGSLFLSEVISTDDGSPKRPAYGTFVNEQQVETPVMLRNGDEIRLGKRVRLRFESVEPHVDEDATVQIDEMGGEKTMDNFGSLS
jgi:hypothetical protein